MGFNDRDKSILLTSVINLDFWNEAGWKGVVFVSNGQLEPYMGLAFENREAGINIFKEWKERFGDKDIYDEIRISIIEGDIEGEHDGYTIHINTNTENMLSKCKENNLTPESTLIMTVGRYNRMNPPKNSRNLENFKDDYKRFLSYKIFPVYINKDNELEPLWDYVIEKTEVIFRDVNDIKSDDFDAVCVKKSK